jgi:PAS domain S-box-containing protein
MRRRLQERPGTIIAPLAAAFIALAVISKAIGNPTLHGVLVTAAGLGGAAIVTVGLKVHRPAHAKGWRIIAAALTLLGVGFACFYAPTWIGRGSPGSPGLPDALWILLYPLLIAGLAIKIVRRRSRVGALIDLATMTLAAVTLMVPLLIDPFVHDSELPERLRALQIAYAVFDAALLACVVQFALMRPRRWADRLLLAGTVVYVTGDLSWNWMTLTGNYADGSLPDIGWVLGPLLMSLGALHPSVRESGTGPVTDDRLHWWSALLLGAAPVLGPFLIAFADGADPDRHLGAVVLILIASVAMATLSLTRLGLLVRNAQGLSADLEVAVGERDVLLVASQHRYQTLIEQLPGVVYIIMPGDGDADGASVMYLSPRVEDLMGVTVEECLMDIDALARGIHPDDMLVLADTVAIASGGQRRVEYRYQRPDGEWIWVRDEGSMIKGPNGEQMLQGILFDISAQKRAESEHERLQLDLRLAQKLEAVGQLAAGIAHEINTPIQFVGDTTQFLEEAFTDLLALLAAHDAALTAVQAGEPLEQVAARVAEAEDEADLEYLRERVPAAFTRAVDGLDRVSKIVRAMRELAHPPTTEMAPVDLNATIERTLIVAANEFKYVADLETDLGPLPDVTCNGGDINQVILNLIVNASHAIEDVVADTDGRGTIRISSRLDDDDVVITIADTGGGIPDEVAARIFDPFFTTKDIGRGTGQGLAIARRIVTETHGGELSFDTMPGEGTAFHIRLPLVARAVTA